MSTEPQKKVYIKSYGCQMNAYDAERMAEILTAQGYQSTQDAHEANLIVLNTCHIREKAAEKVYSEIGRIKKHHKDKGQNLLLAVGGCVGQAEGKEILKRAPTVDFVFGPQNYHELPQLLEKAQKGQKPVAIDFPDKTKFELEPRSKPQFKQATSFLTIQEGCDKFCTFCVVPYTRGAEYSRPYTDILKEAKILIENGAKDINLLGQNVNAYHGLDENGDILTLEKLLYRLADETQVERLRYTTSHPCDMTQGLIDAHKNLPQLMPYLHLPVQSGSDKILKAMNRKHTSSQYKSIIEKVRNACPDIALSCDFIVGFPGETDKDFQDTMNLIEEVTFAQAYSFNYSPRPGTPAADKKTQVEDHIKDQRLYALQALVEKQRQDYNAKAIGQVMPVLFEKQGKYKNQWTGKTQYLQTVQVESEDFLPGNIFNVEIKSKTTNSLFGNIVSDSKQQQPLREAI